MKGSAIKATATMGNRMLYRLETGSVRGVRRSEAANMMAAARTMPSTACTSMGTGSFSTVVATWLTAPNTNEKTPRYDTAFTKSAAPTFENPMWPLPFSGSFRAISGTAESTMTIRAKPSSRGPVAQKMKAAAPPPIR